LKERIADVCGFESRFIMTDSFDVIHLGLVIHHTRLPRCLQPSTPTFFAQRCSIAAFAAAETATTTKLASIIT